MPVPFTIAVPDTDLADLKARLLATRFAPTLDEAGWDYGVEDDFLRRFIDFWANQYDWRASEAALNGFAQFIETIEGEAVHFVHVRGQGQTNIPLLLTNGWPSNFVELLPLIPLLTTPRNGIAFDIVIPSMPGYGFSGQPRQRGMNMTRIAPLWAELMTRLGYDRFMVSGSDLGSGVEMALVRNFPQRLIGAHYINVFSGYPRTDDASPAEKAYFGATDLRAHLEGAYVMVQGTKPATLAVGLNDSPAGLAAWILEKYHFAAGHDGVLEDTIPFQTLATIISVYWFTQTIGSSMRLYKEAFADPELLQTSAHDVPHGVLVPPRDNPAPRAWGDRHVRNIVRWTELDAGGHFPALEGPEAMADDIHAFYNQIA